MNLPLIRRSLLLGGAAALASPSVLRAQRAGRRLRLGHETTPASPFGQAAIVFAREVATRTGGRWSVDVVSDGALGSQLDMMRNIGSGSLDLGTIATLSLGGQIQPLEIFGVPFLFRDLAHARAVFDGPVGESYREAWATKDMHLLGWGELGVRNMTANRPVQDAAAMGGLKLRIPPSPVIADVFRAMGADPAVIPWSETSDALRTGRIQAQENPIGIIVSARLNEVQSHLMLTSHTYTVFGIVASADVMEDLNAEDRAHFVAAAEAGKAASRATADRFDREGIAALRSAGMTIITDPDMASFRTARNAANDLLASAFGSAALQRIGSV